MEKSQPDVKKIAIGLGRCFETPANITRFYSISFLRRLKCARDPAVSCWSTDVQFARNTTHECGSAEGRRPADNSPVQVISDHRAAPHSVCTTSTTPRLLWNHQRLAHDGSRSPDMHVLYNRRLLVRRTILLVRGGQIGRSWTINNLIIFKYIFKLI